jgi:sulfate transport system substrate-binding protein
VLLAWENEALLVTKKMKPGEFEIVTPSVSILAEPPVTWIDKVTSKHGTEKLAKAYLEFLYTSEGQDIAARNYYRPRLEGVAKKYADQFPPMTLLTIDDPFGGWAKVQSDHFGDGGVFDQIYGK